MQSRGCLPAALASKAEKLLVPVTQHLAVTENTVMSVQLNGQVNIAVVSLTLCSASSALIGTSQNVPTSGHQDLLALLAPGQVRLKNHAIIPPVTFQKLEKKQTTHWQLQT